MGKIEVLPQHIANLIAAGEVVERPASVIKELIENSLDAGATAITAELQRGGISLIRVTDNGEGMSPDDAERAFLRHGTSKLRTGEDLAAISTLGFRGEALAAIAAVAHVELLTRRRGDTSGTALTIESGEVTERSESGCPEGTTIIVRGLFENTPARRKYLKKDNTEAAHAQEVIVRAALSRPDVAFRFIKDGSEVIFTPGDTKLSSCIYSLFGRDFAKNLTPCDLSMNGINVRGYVTKPEAARSTRAMQYFSVSGRPVRTRLMSAALEEAFADSLPAGKIPCCVIAVSLDFSLCDVNIHPAKAEIKFMREREVFDAVYCAVKAGLSASKPGVELTITPSAALTFHAAPQPDKTFTHQSSESFRVNREPEAGREAYLPALRETPYSPGNQNAGFMAQTSGTYSSTSEPHYPAVSQTPPTEREAAESRPANEAYTIGSHRYIGEALGGFLLAEAEDSLWIIDKHAAHERMIYNSLKKGGAGLMSQRLLSPVTVELTKPECEALLSETEFLQEAGFELEDFGGSSLIVRSAPDNIDPSELHSLLGELALELRGGKKPDLRDAALHSIACRAAVKLGKQSAREDMENLVKLVMETPDLRHCPHGRPVAARITRSQLGRQFNR